MKVIGVILVIIYGLSILFTWMSFVYMCFYVKQATRGWKNKTPDTVGMRALKWIKSISISLIFSIIPVLNLLYACTISSDDFLNRTLDENRDKYII